MATTTRRATARRRRTAAPTPPRPRPSQAKQLDRAVKQFLKAIPVDHLDRRLTALEKWIRGLQKDVRKLITPQRRPARRTTTRVAARRTAHHRA